LKNIVKKPLKKALASPKLFFSDNVTIICHINVTTGALISAQIIGLE
jgi:hypothetical protein